MKNEKWENEYGNTQKTWKLIANTLFDAIKQEEEKLLTHDKNPDINKILGIIDITKSHNSELPFFY